MRPWVVAGCLGLSCLLAGDIRAELQYLSDVRSVGASGYTWLHGVTSPTYSQAAQPVQAFAGFSNNVSGEVSLVDPEPDIYGNRNMRASSSASASISSSLGSTGIFAQSSLSASAGGPFDQSGGGGSANATSLLDISFTVSEPSLYHLAYSVSLFPYQGWEIQARFEHGLTDSSGSILGVAQLDEHGMWICSGLLDPGKTYDLRVAGFAGGGVVDPLGESASVNYTVSFDVSQVPEPSAAFSLGLGALVIMVRGARRRFTSPQ